ncbi:MAG: haloacid dehalogenase-like hydrolase, partial [Elusimicrobiota bacterium]|nr:haloacid dehalogenase-like hydrolase [Elusimicrobiota bacterium]
AVVFAFSITVTAWAADAKTLDAGKWDKNTRAQLQKLIDTVGNKSKDYNADKKPYAVFDWDQTCIFNDTEEALFRYMIANILFKATPKEFAKAIYNGVPKDNFGDDFKNKDGNPINIKLIGADLEADYAFIYDNYIKEQKMSLADIQKTDQFKDWQAKLAFLYEAIGDKFSADISYPWVLYLFVGMTVDEVKAVSEQSDDFNLKEKIGTYVLESPASLPGKAGVVSYKYKSGLRIQPEMVNLMAVLRANGIDVYVCSASLDNVVRVFAGTKYGYNVPEENVIGMKIKLDKKGKYLPEYDYSNKYPQTQRAGKVTAINQVLVKKYGYGPVFVAGDSSGDFNMISEFPDTKLGLIINRLYDNSFGKLGLIAWEDLQKKNPTPRYVLQGRDENAGAFRPSISTIKMGQTKEAAFKATIDPTIKK